MEAEQPQWYNPGKGSLSLHCIPWWHDGRSVCSWRSAHMTWEEPDSISKLRVPLSQKFTLLETNQSPSTTKFILFRSLISLTHLPYTSPHLWSLSCEWPSTQFMSPSSTDYNWMLVILNVELSTKLSYFFLPQLFPHDACTISKSCYFPRKVGKFGLSLLLCSSLFNPFLSTETLSCSLNFCPSTLLAYLIPTSCFLHQSFLIP